MRARRPRHPTARARQTPPLGLSRRVTRPLARAHGCLRRRLVFSLRSWRYYSLVGLSDDGKREGEGGGSHLHFSMSVRRMIHGHERGVFVCFCRDDDGHFFGEIWRNNATNQQVGDDDNVYGTLTLAIALSSVLFAPTRSLASVSILPNLRLHSTSLHLISSEAEAKWPVSTSALQRSGTMCSVLRVCVFLS